VDGQASFQLKREKLLVTLIQPPFLEDNIATIYPSLPYIATGLRSQSIPHIYINLNRDYITYEKRCCLYACRQLAKHRSLYPSAAAVPSNGHGKLRYLYWTDYLCSMLAYLGERVAVLDDGRVVIDETNSLDAFFSYIWEPYVTTLGIRVPLPLDPRYRPDKGEGLRFAEFVRERAMSWSLGLTTTVAITVPATVDLGYALCIARVVKELQLQTTVVFGGTAFSSLSSTYLNGLLNLPYIDFIVKGEGEEGLAQLVKEIEGNPDQIHLHKGANTGLVHTIQVNLRSVPAVRYPVGGGSSKLGEICLLQSRGCFFGRCAYCSYIKLYGKNYYRERPLSILLDELKDHFQRGYTRFRFSTEALPQKYALQLGEGILSAGLKIRWRCFIRPKPFRLDTLKLVRQSGGNRFIVGVETTSDRLLRLYGKGTSSKEVWKLFNQARDVRLQLEVNIIPDLPTTTVDDALETLVFLRQNRDVIFQINLSRFVVHFNSEVAQRPEAFGIRLLSTDYQFLRESSFIPFERLSGASESQLEPILTQFYELASEVNQNQGAHYGSLVHGLPSISSRPLGGDGFTADAPSLAVEAKGINRELSLCVTYNFEHQNFTIQPGICGTSINK